MTGRLLTAREVADQLGVSAGALLRWTRSGDVPAIKLPGGAIRYEPDQIDRWLAERSTGAAAREVVDHPNDRARDEPYVRLRSLPSTTRPHNAAGSEEDHDGRT